MVMKVGRNVQMFQSEYNSEILQVLLKHKWVMLYRRHCLPESSITSKLDKLVQVVNIAWGKFFDGLIHIKYLDAFHAGSPRKTATQSRAKGSEAEIHDDGQKTPPSHVGNRRQVGNTRQSGKNGECLLGANSSMF